MESLSKEYFVFTSNIDGHFEREGFDAGKILEIHGSTHFMQCSRGLKCGRDIWSAEGVSVDVDEETFRAISQLPECKFCDAIARPNILMFGDDAWIPLRCVEQENRYEAWLKEHRGSNLVAIEFGAGTAVPTVRYECKKRGRTLIRVNPCDYIAPADAISVPLNALDAIRGIDAALAA